MLKPGFDRDFPRTHQQNLKGCPLYPELQSLVKSGELFPAIRERVMDFYHGGHRALRRSRDGYRSNDYFLACAKERAPGQKFRDTLYRQGDTQVPLRSILERCREKAEKDDPEAWQLAKIIPFFSFAVDDRANERPILIDVEARFAPLQAKWDKIDLVFLLPGTQALMFVEGKRRSDGRIRNREGLPEVISKQVPGYRAQLQDREEIILKAYGQAADAMLRVFGCTFPAPQKVLKQVPIMVVGDTGSETDLQNNPKAYDKWLEPELARTGNSPYQIWEKDGALLFDARAIFAQPTIKAADLAAGIDELASRIG